MSNTANLPVLCSLVSLWFVIGYIFCNLINKRAIVCLSSETSCFLNHKFNWLRFCFSIKPFRNRVHILVMVWLDSGDMIRKQIHWSQWHSLLLEDTLCVHSMQKIHDFRVRFLTWQLAKLIIFPYLYFFLSSTSNQMRQTFVLLTGQLTGVHWDTLSFHTSECIMCIGNQMQRSDRYGATDK